MKLASGMETAVNRRVLPFEMAATNLVSSSHLHCDRRSRIGGGRFQEEQAPVVAFLSCVLPDTTFASAPP